MRGPLSNAIGGAIGLASEAIAARKNKNKGDSGEEPPRNAFLEDEDEWKVDDAQEDLYNTDSQSDQATLTWEPSPTSKVAPLDHPLENAVVIPQRRPASKAHGFVRAYAPALEECDIDQDTFLRFLKGFDNAIKAQPLFIAANIAVGAGVLTSKALIGANVGIDIGAFLVHTTVEVGRRVYIAKQYNNYLKDMNEKLFQPRGLYALIMAYKPGSSDAAAIVDLRTNVAISAGNGGKTKNWFGVSSGVTHEEELMPLSAPLIFPDGSTTSQNGNALKKTTSFISDYNDRRAQALWAANNPNSSLNIHSEENLKFASKWSDPNHPVNHGGPLCILTGGKFSRDAKKYEAQQRKNLEENRAGDDNGPGTGLKGLKRRLREPTLYLMIVNMPSEEEMAIAAELLRKQEEETTEKENGDVGVNGGEKHGSA